MAAIVFFRLALDACYVWFVSPTYFEHFLLPLPVNFAGDQYALSFLPLLLVSIFLPQDKALVTGPVLFIVLMFVFIPLTSLFGLDQNRPFLPVGTTAMAVLIAVIFATPARLRLRIPIMRGGGHLPVAISLFFVVSFLAWSYVSGATSGFSLSIADIYDYRRDQSAILDVGPMGYMNAWAQKIFALWLFCLTLEKRRWLLTLLTYSFFVYFFGVTSARIHLFLPILGLLVWAVYSSDVQIRTGYHIAGLLLLALLCVVLLFELEVIGAIAIRRAFFVSASATFEWFEFFASRPKVYWSDNILSGLVATEYSGMSLPFFIGDYLAPDKDVSFNNGLVSSGYAHAGIVGVVFYAAIVGLILRFTNGLVRRGVPVWISAALLAGPVRTAWADSDLAAALLTHGLLAALALLWLHGVPRARTDFQVLTGLTNRAS